MLKYFTPQPPAALLEVPGAACGLESRVEDVESVREADGIDPIWQEKVSAPAAVRRNICSVVFSARVTDGVGIIQRGQTDREEHFSESAAARRSGSASTAIQKQAKVDHIIQHQAAEKHFCVFAVAPLLILITSCQSWQRKTCRRLV